MKETVTKCDNPGCESRETPEHPGHVTTGKGYVPPYGWLLVELRWIGTGLPVMVEVCSMACLEPAVNHRLNEEAAQEGEK
jgi:hypothetical protein